MNEKVTKEKINNTLWKAADTFRGTIDSSVYKDYILVMLFLKYVSDVYKERKKEYQDRYENDAERVERALKRERFVLSEDCTFDSIYAQRNESNIGEIINTVLNKIEDENRSKLQGVFRNIDFNSESVLGKTKDRNAMLKTLLIDFNELDLNPNNLSGNDVIGDSYEYMIANFASDAGKKGGEFYTPSEVSELLSQLVKPVENDRIYDPTCGSGSLLLKAFNKIPNGKAQIYGQERNGQTHALAIMNMFLHGVDDAKIEWGDTLSDPKHLENDRLMKFQVIVSNPPFSLDKWAKGFNHGTNDKEFKFEASMDKYNRFALGVPPKSTGDYAFILHMINSLADDGRMGVILPHGVLFRGSSEGKIRQKLIEMNLLDAVIGLPANLFYGPTISACILIFKKNRNRKDLLFIDASAEGNFEKNKNQNVLRPQDIKKIVDSYEKYESKEKYSYVASFDEIKENEFNLNIPRYVDTFEEEEIINLDEVKQDINKIKDELIKVENQIEIYLKDLGL